ncbi:HNH endonuclease [Streptomyces sp. NPDC092952]|uniref:HNH endonuclease n=1 Tax=Streptomyces sp. NPDC092952 TaxID=3366018 RepID=UPI003801DC7B
MSHDVRYTRARLTEAAARCSDLDEVIVFFGARPHSGLRRYLARRFAHYGIDTSHFRPFGRIPRPTAEELRAAVAGSVSVAGALRRLQRPDSTSQRAALRRWIAEENIATPHFLGQAHQRGKPGPTPRRHHTDILVKHDSRRRTRSSLLRRALGEIGVPEKCAECGTGPKWLGKAMTLEVDHINGDWSDGRPANLRLLCPNCHAITSTWCRGGDVRSIP